MESPSSDVWWDKLSRVADGSVGTENEELQHYKAVLETAESKFLPSGRGHAVVVICMFPLRVELMTSHPPLLHHLRLPRNLL